MMAKRRHSQPPIALLWTRGDQRRFIDAVERFCSHVHELQQVVHEVKELLTSKRKPPKPGRIDMKDVCSLHPPKAETKPAAAPAGDGEPAAAAEKAVAP